LRDWRPKDSGTALAGPSMSYLMLDAAIMFGVTIEQFKRCSIVRQAEMVAHMIHHHKRQGFMQEEMQAKAEADAKNKATGGGNPLDRQRKRWGVKE